eukprot:COSAG01_NODE_8938_length_2608_cov_6.614333_3_plen_243_part_00
MGGASQPPLASGRGQRRRQQQGAKLVWLVGDEDAEYGGSSGDAAGPTSLRRVRSRGVRGSGSRGGRRHTGVRSRGSRRLVAPLAVPAARGDGVRRLRELSSPATAQQPWQAAAPAPIPSVAAGSMLSASLPSSSSLLSSSSSSSVFSLSLSATGRQRLQPLPGLTIAVAQQGVSGAGAAPSSERRRKQLFGGSSAPSRGGSFIRPPRNPVLEAEAVARGREIAAEIATHVSTAHPPQHLLVL